MKKVYSFLLFLSCLLVSGIGSAQSSPRTIKLVVPFAAGGQMDVMARIIADSLGKTMPANVVVENLAGAGGVIAARKVLNSPADGLTLFEGSPSQLVLAGLVNKDNAVNSADFTPVHMIGTSPYVVFARTDLPANNADELAELARESARKGTPLTYASVGVGTLNHVLGEELSRRIGAPMVHVPYKGGAEVVRDLVGGRVDLLLNIYTAQQVAMAQEGRLKFIAALSPKRQELLPQVPSIDESNSLKGFYASIWMGLFVKAGTPAPIVSQLNQAIAQVLANEEVRESLLEHTATRAAKPETSMDMVSAEYARGVKQFQDLAKSAGVAKGD